MQIEWPESFDRQLKRYEMAADEGKEYETIVLTYLLAQLEEVAALEAEPEEDTFTIKQVRQCRKHRVWRVSHPYHEGIAVRLIVWFPPEEETAVVALFSGDKANMGDVFYNTVEMRSDTMIQAWQREKRVKKQ